MKKVKIMFATLTAMFSLTLLTFIPQLSAQQCPGQYYGDWRYTNSTGQIWISPPAGAHFCQVTASPSLSPQPTNTWIQAVRKSDLAKWCENNQTGLTFPATNGTTYGIIYLYAGPATNGTVHLDVIFF